MITEKTKAPDFELQDPDGNIHSLSSLLEDGKRKLVLCFYPKDNSSGCTAEACSLNGGLSGLEKAGYRVVGISPDGAASHRKFIEKHSLGFLLLSDTDHTVSEEYGTWVKKKLYGREYMGILRKTFLIGVDGTIEKIFEKVDIKRHFEQIMDAIR